MSADEKSRRKKITPSIKRCAYSLEEHRAMWNLGKTSQYRLIADGTLPTVKVGRRRLVTAEGNEQFAKNIGA